MNVLLGIFYHSLGSFSSGSFMAPYARIKKMNSEYNYRLCFFGAISVQSLLQFGAPDDVIKEFKDRKNTIGKNGGWICAPTHHVQLDTPL